MRVWLLKSARHGVADATDQVQQAVNLAQYARQAPWNDCAMRPVLVAQAYQHTPMRCVLADAEFNSERNHTFGRQQLKADSIIPAKRHSSCKASGVRLEMWVRFPTEPYGRCSLIESVFSAAKRKLSCRTPGRTFHTQSCQVLLLGLVFDLYLLWPSLLTGRISTES